MSKANAMGNNLKLEEITKKEAQVEITKKEAAMELTDVEKATIPIVVERVNILQAELQKAQFALSGLITQAVQARRLDPNKFGVNLAAGRILPVETPKGDGVEP